MQKAISRFFLDSGRSKSGSYGFRRTNSNRAKNRRPPFHSSICKPTGSSILAVSLQIDDTSPSILAARGNQQPSSLLTIDFGERSAIMAAPNLGTGSK
ncbi:hypothetical protein ACLOJK_007873 [Asimina triloba]